MSRRAVGASRGGRTFRRGSPARTGPDRRDPGPGRIPIALRTRTGNLDRSGVRRLLSSCLEAEGVEAEAGLGLLVCGDRTMRRLNREFRGKDRTTDVLSFADGAPPVPGEPRFLGDLAVSLPACLRQAAEREVDPGVELLRLLVHGTLHLLGYDHERPEDRRRMAPREAALRRRLLRAGFGPGLVTARRDT